MPLMPKDIAHFITPYSQPGTGTQLALQGLQGVRDARRQREEVRSNKENESFNRDQLAQQREVSVWEEDGRNNRNIRTTDTTRYMTDVQDEGADRRQQVGHDETARIRKQAIGKEFADAGWRGDHARMQALLPVMEMKGLSVEKEMVETQAPGQFEQTPLATPQLQASLQPLGYGDVAQLSMQPPAVLPMTAREVETGAALIRDKETGEVYGRVDQAAMQAAGRAQIEDPIRALVMSAKPGEREVYQRWGDYADGIVGIEYSPKQALEEMQRGINDELSRKSYGKGGKGRPSPSSRSPRK